MENRSKGSEECLLGRDEECFGDNYNEKYLTPHQPTRPWFINTASTILVHMLLLYIAVLLTFKFLRPTMPCNPRRSVQVGESHPSLLNGIIKFEEKAEYHSPRYPWKQAPSLELDQLWDDLLFAQNIRITPQEMEMLNANTTNGVRISDGDYVGALGVFHHLHCLNSMRKVLHAKYHFHVPESAYPKETMTLEHTGLSKLLTISTLESPRLTYLNMDHCIDTLRQALMCHASTAVYTVEWVADSHEPVSKHVRGKATTACVKWDSVNDWARQRALRGGNYKYAPGPYEKAHHEK